MPVWCSTVTPGKLATFWRSPVRALKRVDLPALGGPTRATVRWLPERGALEEAGAQCALPLMGVALLAVPDLDVPGGFLAQGDFGPVDAEHARTASRSATAGGNDMPGKETHFHQAAGHVLGQIELVKNGFLAFAHLGKGTGERRTPVVHLIETELQHDFSMPLGEGVVKLGMGNGLVARTDIGMTGKDCNQAVPTTRGERFTPRNCDRLLASITLGGVYPCASH